MRFYNLLLLLKVKYSKIYFTLRGLNKIFKENCYEHKRI